MTHARDSLALLTETLAHVVTTAPKPEPKTNTDKLALTLEIEALREDLDLILDADTSPPSKIPDLREKSHDEAVELIKEWFFDNFEDPVHNTSWDSAEGGYIYAWGGPYDAREELSEAFGSAVSNEALEEALSEIENEG
jgi:hypothetical protein